MPACAVRLAALWAGASVPDISPGSEACQCADIPAAERENLIQGARQGEKAVQPQHRSGDAEGQQGADHRLQGGVSLGAHAGPGGQGDQGNKRRRNQSVQVEQGSNREGDYRVLLKSKPLLARRLFLPFGRFKMRKLGYQEAAKPLFDTPNPYFKNSMKVIMVLLAIIGAAASLRLPGSAGQLPAQWSHLSG
jgi:hypothetical protein